MAEYGTIWTRTGRNKEANHLAGGPRITLTHLAVGDGNGAAYEPNDAMTALAREVWRGGVIRLEVDAKNPAYVIVEAVIPTNIGGWTVREAGLFDDAGDLIVITKMPETYKPQLAEGAGKELLVRIIIEKTSAESTPIRIDPAIATASRVYVDVEIGKAKAYAEGAVQAHASRTNNPHGVTAEQLGAASAADLAALADLVAQISAPIGTLLYNAIPGYEPPLYAPASGHVTLRADYPELWALVEAEAIADETWLTQAGTQSSVGFFSSGDGETTFRWPLLVDFVRAADPANGRPVGTFQGDAIRNMTGIVSVVSQSFAVAGSASGVFVKTSVGPTAPNTPAPGDEDSSSTGTLNFDASRVVPTADENRPKSISYPAWIKYA